MAGIKVTLLRTSIVTPGAGAPVERVFEGADNWAFIFDRNISSLIVLKNNEPKDDGSFTRSTIAEFPSDNVESVEFA